MTKPEPLTPLPRGLQLLQEPELLDPHTRKLVSLAIILAWYACNIGVLLLNKRFLSIGSFRFPIFLTLCHMIACFVLGIGFSTLNVTTTRRIRTLDQFKRVCALSALFCASVVLGNVSLKHTSISFNQMLGASTPLFTALFAALIMRRHEPTTTYLTLFPVTGGVLMSSWAEPVFDGFGCASCLGATACRAFKSVVQSVLLSNDGVANGGGGGRKLDAMSLLVYMSGVSVLILLPLCAVMEPGAIRGAVRLSRESPTFVCWLLANSCLAYGVNLANFLVTKYTSALTLQVLGNAKGIIAAIVSVWMFQNYVTPYGWLGYAITVMGVLAYSESKRGVRSAAATK